MTRSNSSAAFQKYDGACSAHFGIFPALVASKSSLRLLSLYLPSLAMYSACGPALPLPPTFTVQWYDAIILFPLESVAVSVADRTVSREAEKQLSAPS